MSQIQSGQSAAARPTPGARLGILVCGHVPAELQNEHGDYPQLFAQLLGEQAFTYQSYAVVDGIFPDRPDAADGWLITGSRHGAYEDHDWIPPLEDFIREIHALAIPLVGICFGHQIIAQALGGRVIQHAGGWSVGRVSYQLAGEFDLPEAPLLAFHQDQVVELPPEARPIGSSPFCRYAALAYGDRVLSLQPHPEFTNAFTAALLQARGAILPDAVRTAARDSLGPPLATRRIAAVLRSFLQRGRRQPHGSQDSTA